MPLPSSGTLSMSQINGEFGRGNDLNSYRGTLYYTSSAGPYTFPSGTIAFSDFYGTQAAAPSSSNSVTEGASGSSLGYISGQIGSISPSTTIGGRTIVHWYKITIKGSIYISLAVSGDQRGSWWTYGTYRGTTFYRANCGIPAGSYDGTITSWAIASSEWPTFTGSGTYTLTLYP